MPSPFEIGVLFHHCRRIQKHYLRQFRSGGRAVYLSLEALFYQLWQKPAVVHVSVSKEYGVQRLRWDGERLPVAVYQASLSYQEYTVARLPATILVRDKSIVAPYGSPKISEETNANFSLKMHRGN